MPEGHELKKLDMDPIFERVFKVRVAVHGFPMLGPQIPGTMANIINLYTYTIYVTF